LLSFAPGGESTPRHPNSSLSGRGMQGRIIPLKQRG
jgi:hypothetical protein